MTVTIGNKRMQCSTYGDAAKAFSSYVSVNGFGASDLRRGDGEIRDDGNRLIAHVSYNGKVWPGTSRAWRPGLTPLVGAV